MFRASLLIFVLIQAVLLRAEDLPELSEQQVRALFEKIGSSEGKGMHLDEVKAFSFKMKTSEAEGQVLEIAQDMLSDGPIPLDKVVELYAKYDAGYDAPSAEDVAKTATAAKAADLDRDGLLSKEELLSLHMPELNKDVLAFFISDTLSALDLDHDGKVSLNEYEKYERDSGGNERFKDQFAALDKNQDGFLDVSELRTAHTAQDETAIAHMVQLADTDQDGYVTSQEFLEVSRKMHQQYNERRYSALAYDQFVRWTERLEL